MNVHRNKATWLLIILALLSVGGFLGWWYVHQNHDHEQHADCDHDQHTGHDHKEHDVHNHDQHASQDHGGPAEHDGPGEPPPGQVKLTPAAVQLANIKTAPVVNGPLGNWVSFTGELVFNEDRLAKIHSRVPGRVVRIVADYGQAVRAGGVLAIIDSVELSQAQMASRQAAAKFNAAQKSYDRAVQLYEGKAISRAELQERQARLEVERADLENAQNHLRLLGASGNIAQDTRHPGPLPSRGEGKKENTLNTQFTLALRSPIAGRVMERKVTPGLVIKEDEELFTVANTSSLWCFVQIPEKDLPLVQVGAPVTVSISTLPKHDFPGRVDYLADVVDKSTRTVRGRVRVENPHNLLKAGMFADIAIRVGQRRALNVPESAVLAANGEHFVFVEKGPGTYQKHLIKTGAKGGGGVEVLAGVEAGEPVVVQGGFALKSELEKGAFQGCGGGHAH
jgi:cobalt-zinc-cadmium efflux system membrane fusion protein